MSDDDPSVAFHRGTPRPERLVCEAARNDYRSEGVANYDFRDVVEDAALDAAAAADVLAEHTIDGYGPSRWSKSYYEDAVVEARKRSLLKRLMERGHWGPFEHPQATLTLEGVTRVSMAQITRHRHFTFDIMSLRYCDVSDESVDDRFEIPPEVTGESAATREGVHEIDGDVEPLMREAYEVAVDYYRMLLDRGVPQEEARKVLPMGTKVNIVMSGNARAWLHLLNIRGKANVQGEARRLADQIHDELSDWMPYTFEHYDENVLPRRLNP